MILACLKVGPNLVVYHEFLRCTIVWKHPVLGENLIIGFGCIIISSHIQQYIPFETLISPYKYVYIYIDPILMVVFIDPWINKNAFSSQVRMIFESALELMSCTQVILSVAYRYLVGGERLPGCHECVIFFPWKYIGNVGFYVGQTQLTKSIIFQRGGRGGPGPPTRDLLMFCPIENGNGHLDRKSDSPIFFVQWW